MSAVRELEWIHSIHQLRNPFFDEIFKFLNFFDRPEFFLVLIPIIWLCCGWRIGLRLYFILLISALVNHGFKEFFASPRPYHLDPQLGIVHVKGFGFPSGAAQTVVFLSGILIHSCKGAWKWVVVFSYIAAISFSRLYLGVHFPSDILGGWLIGLWLFGIYLYLFPLVERELERLSAVSILFLSQTILLLLLFWQNANPSIHMCSVGMGLSLGTYILYSYHITLDQPNTGKEYAMRSFIGVIGTLAYYWLTSQFQINDSFLYAFMQFLLLGLWISLGSYFVCYKLFSNHKTMKTI